MKSTYTHFTTAYLPLSLTTVIPMAESDASVSDHDSESSLSESLGIKTLQARFMVLASFRKPPKPNLDRTRFGLTVNSLSKWTTLRIFIDTLWILLQCLRPPHPSDDIMEATECLKAWWDFGVISQQW